MGIYNSLIGKRLSAHPTVEELLQSSRGKIETQSLRNLKALVMLADEDNVITFMNESVETMLRNAETDIRKDLPHFSVDSLIGSKMDVFHKNPAHQHDLLARLTKPYEANILVGGRQFTLNATPVFDQGKRIGTAVEWSDNTEAHLLRMREKEMQEKQTAQNAELGVIKTALDTVSSNVMMADNDGNIFFANQSVLTLLKKAEGDLRKALPGFRVGRIVGSNFDIFHRNPAHQQQLLKNLTQPYEANISVGVRKFRLTAAPVFGSAGERFGTVVEWLDRTAEIKMEEDVDAVINAAIKGDLGHQIDHTGYSSFLGRIAQGINQLIINFSDVLGDAEQSLNALSRGDLCRRISTSYEGRFDTLKNDINGTIDRLREVVSDIEMSTASVKQSSHEISLGNMNLSQHT